ncbi:PAQR family membrane homeostasis protein TrhA [Psychrobacter fulvigenes]|uniref:PAQR family membrane homeostasis protein TrhA n=1 Tax=Psychrobacter fulvigenes TaxID=533323 RepID=UPI001917BA5B|nr:hemolysin III family protein [Psychrobacter fulvigenes]
MHTQTLSEERLNTLTHTIGAFLGAIGLVLLLLKDSYKTKFSQVGILVYGSSIILLFTASAMYHWVTNQRLKQKLRVLDHVSIYLLIAGTYTPVLVINLLDGNGVFLLIAVWTIAAVGTIMKLFFTGRFEVFSTLLYLVMGWLIVIDFSALKEAVPFNGLLYLAAGGLFYTVGIVFYAIEKIPYNHVIWHLFVLAGAVCHYLMVLNYVV